MHLKKFVCFTIFVLRTVWELLAYLSLKLIQVRALSKKVMFLWPAVYIRFWHPWSAFYVQLFSQFIWCRIYCL